jgi:hypothetical protein
LPLVHFALSIFGDRIFKTFCLGCSGSEILLISVPHVARTIGVSHWPPDLNSVNILKMKNDVAGHQWLTPIILATQEAEIRRIVVQSQSGQIVLRDPILKNPSQK